MLFNYILYLVFKYINRTVFKRYLNTIDRYYYAFHCAHVCIKIIKYYYYYYYYYCATYGCVIAWN